MNKDTLEAKSQINSPSPLLRVGDVTTSAVLSDCKKYRYSLTRVWDDNKPRVLFIMLNPSTADAEKDDPTIRRCIGFAKDWGYGGLYVVNLFARVYDMTISFSPYDEAVEKYTDYTETTLEELKAM